MDDPDAEHDGDEPGEDAPRWGGGDVALGILASVLAANITLLLALSLSGVATFVPERDVYGVYDLIIEDALARWAEAKELAPLLGQNVSTAEAFCALLPAIEVEGDGEP